MTGQGHWLEPLLMLLGGAGLALLVWMGSHVELLHRRKRKVLCPATGTAVRCTVVRDTLAKDWVDIEECSRFGRAPVTCDKACLSRLNA